MCVCVTSPLTEPCVCVCVCFKGHMAIRVISTPQRRRLIWRRLPWEQQGAHGLARLPKCYTHSALCVPTNWGRCVYLLSGCVWECQTKKKRRRKKQSHRSHCCDPVPGVGTRSRAPLTGGSTISHSLADGPVYSATQRHRANERGGGGEEEWIKKGSHSKINRHHVVWLRRHKLASWQTVMLRRRTVYESHRPMPKRTQRDRVN